MIAWDAPYAGQGVSVNRVWPIPGAQITRASPIIFSVLYDRAPRPKVRVVVMPAGMGNETAIEGLAKRPLYAGSTIEPWNPPERPDWTGYLITLRRLGGWPGPAFGVAIDPLDGRPRALLGGP